MVKWLGTKFHDSADGRDSGLLIRLGGLEASAQQNEHVVDLSVPTDYYVAHLFLIPDELGPSVVTPFYFASIDLCAITPFLKLLLDTPPSEHGYARRIHRHNYAAAALHRFSYFIIPCYAKNLTELYAEAFGSYLAKIVYVPNGVPIDLLRFFLTYRVPPFVVAESRGCAAYAQTLNLPCELFRQTTAKRMNAEIRRQFEQPAKPLTEEELQHLNRGEITRHIPPNVFIATTPEELLWEESRLHPYPTSGLNLLFPNEALANQMRKRYMPPPPSQRLDPAQSANVLITSIRSVFAQRLSDYLLEDIRWGLADKTLASSLRNRVESYKQTQSAETYEELVREAERHLPDYPGACPLILCCPAINKKSSSHVFRRVLPDRVLKAFYKAVEQDYIMRTDENDFRSAREFAQFKSLAFHRTIENDLLSTVLGLYASSFRQPVLRTPQLASGLFGMLRSLQMTHLGGNKHAFIRDLRVFCETLRDSLPLTIREFIRSLNTRNVKLISDLPLEWLAIDDVPLMFRCILNRLPLTPGNGIFTHFNTCREDVHLGLEQARRVLVCNCLSPNDQLFEYPRAFSGVLRDMGIEHSYVEPTSVEEYAAVLSANKPYILVHWGHGSYDRAADRGYLHIRDEKTEVWDLRGAAIPPIVMLAACETAAIAETHNNPANGWLALGARAVLATYFNVEADLTTVLFTRIFANLMEAVHGEEQMPTWAVVVSKTLILNRYLDFFYGFVDWQRRRGLPSPPGEVFLEYTFLWNRERGSLVEGYRRCPQLLTEALDRFDNKLGESFRDYCRLEATIPHTMFFTHLGSPDTILIGKKPAPRDTYESAAHEYWAKRNLEESRDREPRGSRPVHRT